MLLGPFDARKKRRRCEACAASHLKVRRFKCSGQMPCSKCERRGLVCTPTQPQKGESIILLDRGKQRTLSNWASPPLKEKRKARVALLELTGSSPPKVILDDELGYLYYFDVFSRANNFGGRKRTLNHEVKKHALFQSGLYLKHAMCALGALQAFKLKAPDLPGSSKQALTRSLEHYAKAIAGLRRAIDALSEGQDGQRRDLVNVTILWTTLFLGLFELMNEGTGHGWSQHMVHGTAKALEASGPARFRSGPGRGFLTQARVFEVSRTILFNEASFLTQPGWMALSRQMSSESGPDGEAWRPLDSLLDVMAMCSRLCSVLRSRRTILRPDEDGAPSTEARSVCADGHMLREALESWHSSYGDQGARSDRDEDEDEDDGVLLSRIFFAAVSIYLSGIFDYSISSWRRLGLAPPTLGEAAVEAHAASIAGLAGRALDRTALSPLLFLFPLRIAGARARTGRQRETVARLVGRIEARGFAAAGGVRAELDEVWGRFCAGRLATDAD